MGSESSTAGLVVLPGSLMVSVAMTSSSAGERWKSDGGGVDVMVRRATAEEICARSLRTLRAAGVRHFYLSNLPLTGTERTLHRILELAGFE